MKRFGNKLMKKLSSCNWTISKKEREREMGKNNEGGGRRRDVCRENDIMYKENSTPCDCV